MGALAVGEVVLVRFVSAGARSFKIRPAAVVGLAERGEVILCQITSQAYGSKLAMPISDANFEEGGLERASFARCDKLFTASEAIIARSVGELDWATSDLLQERVAKLFGD